MARRIGIIGIGHVGITTAYTIVTKGLADDLVIIDNKPGLAEGEGLDLRDALGGLNTYTNVIVNDYSALRDADAVIFAGGKITELASGDRNSEIATTKKAIDEAAPQLAQSGFNGVLIDISNPCDVAVNYWQEKLNLPKHQIIGTGTALDTYRMRRNVAEALHVNLADVRGYNMGEHGESQFTAWSTVRVNNEPINTYRNVDYAKLAEASRHGGWQIFKAKGYTSFGIATIACEIAGAVCSDAKRIFSCACFDEAYGISIGHPAIIGRNGVVDNPPLNLPENEKKQYENSVSTIKANLAKLKALG